MAALQIVWFKRDLRIVDHRPLATAALRGPVLPLYVVEPELWQQPDASQRQWFFWEQWFQRQREVRREWFQLSRKLQRFPLRVFYLSGENLVATHKASGGSGSSSLSVFCSFSQNSSLNSSLQ